MNIALAEVQKNCPTAPMKVIVSPGQMVVTPGVLDTFDQHDLMGCIVRHLCGDWGDIGKEDADSNTHALFAGNRLLSAYLIDGEKLWIITEADRSSTTLLLPSEY
jgi:hypothetical protein